MPIWPTHKKVLEKKIILIYHGVGARVEYAHIGLYSRVSRTWTGFDSRWCKLSWV